MEASKRNVFLLIAASTAFGLVMAAIGFCLAFFVLKPPHHHASAGLELRGQGTFTNPLLECDVAADAIASRKEDFTAELTSFIAAIKNERPYLSEAAVYFRDLNNGPVIGVGQNLEFVPASLLKVPIMMVYFHRAESHPDLLDTKVTFAKHSDQVSSTLMFAPPESLEIGKSYTYAELIERMIKYSDNEAMALLWEGIPLSDQVELYKLVGVDARVLSSPGAALSVKQYSIFFRILFNASYLSQLNSERALKLLSETGFAQGIRSGVPERIPVAHKFGERELDEGLKQLHDCGIVYYPYHPYLLCVMTRGESMNVLLKAVQDVSEFVFHKIDSQYDLHP